MEIIHIPHTKWCLLRDVYQVVLLDIDTQKFTHLIDGFTNWTVDESYLFLALMDSEYGTNYISKIIVYNLDSLNENYEIIPQTRIWRSGDFFIGHLSFGAPLAKSTISQFFARNKILPFTKQHNQYSITEINYESPQLDSELDFCKHYFVKGTPFIVAGKIAIEGKKIFIWNRTTFKIEHQMGLPATLKKFVVIDDNLFVWFKEINNCLVYSLKFLQNVNRPSNIVIGWHRVDRHLI